MKKPKNTSLLIVIEGSGLRAWQLLHSAEFFSLNDHLLVLSKSDFAECVPITDDFFSGPRMRFVSHFQIALSRARIYGPEQVNNLTIVAHNGSSKLLHTILDQVKSYLTKDPSVDIVGFSIDSPAFECLTSISDYLFLHSCRLTRGWCTKPSGKEVCTTLEFHQCVGFVPKSLRFGQLSWPTLTSLAIWEGLNNAHLSPKKSLRYPLEPENIEQISYLTPNLAKTFWHTELTFVNFVGHASLEWITAFPSLPKLKDFYSSDTPTSPEVLRWIGGNRKIESLCLAWEKGTRMPWQELKKLKRLRYLNVSGTHLDDEDLRAISLSAKLGTIHAFYTSITAASWETVLNWPGLRGFWASTEAMTGELPKELPETVGLKGVVALNARIEPFIELLSRYPNVKVKSM